MPRFLIKPREDDDVYLEWSSVVDAPVGLATYDELVHRGEKIERLARTQAIGTSAMWCLTDPQEGAYDDHDGLIYLQRGILPRARFGDLADLLANDINAEVPDEWLTPFDDEDGTDG